MTSWVLVVAQDEQRQKLVRAELEEVGFAVETVSTIDAALSWLGVIHPALIVIDEQMAEVERLRSAACVTPSGSGHNIPVLNLAEAVA